VKKSILFVHSQLAQHGSERLMFEISKILIASGHRVGVLTRPFGVTNQYYYSPLLKLGCTIHKKLITIRHIQYLLKPFKIKLHPLSGHFKFFYSLLSKLLLWKTIRDYDSVFVIGMETYCDSLGAMSINDINELEIEVFHVMHKFQQDRDYCSEYNLNEIVILDQKQKKELKSAMPQINCKMFPLIVDFKNLEKTNLYNTPKQKNVRKKTLNIAVISRLFSDRPNEIIFEYFSVLRSKFKLHLHWYGDGNKSLYDDLSKKLSVRSDDITFHGHSSDIQADLYRDAIDLCWQTCMGLSLNYAPIELMSQSFPVYLINIDPDFTSNEDHPCEIATTKQEAINFHENIMLNLDYLDELISNNKNYVIDTYSSSAAYIKMKKIGLV
jgi:hypothetical protein